MLCRGEKLPLLRSRVTALAFSDDGKKLYIGTNRKKVENLATWNLGLTGWVP